MSNKQKDYLAALLAEEDADDGGARPDGVSGSEAGSETGRSADGVADAAPDGSAGDGRQAATTPPPPAPHPSERAPSRTRGSTLLDRESALARVASGAVRQVTHLLLDPARVRIWPGNARSYAHLSEPSCRELIDSIIAEGGQKVPAVVRRVEHDPAHDYEVIAGTRRHWAISWLRAHSYPEMQFVAQVAQLDDEAAFRLADLENRARQDVSDLERARNYAAALHDHYGDHLTRMAERLKLSKGWLSKMLKVASLPDAIIAAFGSPAEVQLKPSYALARALDDEPRAAVILLAAGRIAKEQQRRRDQGECGIPAATVIAWLLTAGQTDETDEKLMLEGAHGRPAVSVERSNRQGVTLRLHAGHGLSEEELLEQVRSALIMLEQDGRGLHR